MTLVAALVLLLVGVALLVPSVVLLAECLCSVLPTRASQADAPTRPAARIALLVPAQNEGRTLGKTLEAISKELGSEDRVLVVADNCTDDTADVARAKGAEVIERWDPKNRGKGFALDAGTAHLATDPPDAVVILDADCSASPGSIRKLADLALTTDRPAQAEDLIVVPKSGSPLARVSALAFLVRNRVRPLGLARLGLPCQLMGTGMAFPWHVIRDAPALGSHLAEDMQMGIELASLGFAPVYCPGAHISSPSPNKASAAKSQRRRWEHGHISTLVDRAPRVIARGIALRKPSVLAMGLDVLVPPLALFVVVLLINIVATLLFWRQTGWSSPVAVASSALGFVLTAVLVAWLKYGRATLPARHLLMIPIYVLWKLPLYLSFSVRGPYTTWERAERSPSGF